MIENYILIISMHADPAMPPGYDEWGGTHTYMKELLDEFTKRHYMCILITRLSMKVLPNVEKYSDYCYIYRLQNGNAEPMSKLKLRDYHEYNVKKIMEIIDKQEHLPLVIHSVYWNSGRIAMELSQHYHIPFVHSVISNSRGRVARGAIEPVPDRAEFEQKIYDSAKEILCVSEDEKQDLVKYYDIPEEKLTVAGQYVDESFLLPAHDGNNFPRLNSTHLNIDSQEVGYYYNKIFQDNNDFSTFWLRKAFIYYGRMDINKGVPVIIKAWYTLYKKYQYQCPPLWLVGGSLPEISQIRSKLRESISDLDHLEESSRIVWWGYLDFKGISTVLLKANVVIMHSLYEPGGRVAVEAMSERIPVIATSRGFAKDIIRDWKNGFLIEYNDISTLAHRMEHFIRQPLLSDSMGKHAKNSAEKVIQQWDFTNRHLMAYGIIPKTNSFEQKSNDDNIEKKNTYFNREINLYPYIFLPLSNIYILNQLRAKIKENISMDKYYQSVNKDSIIARIMSDTDNFIVKQHRPRMTVNPLFNPVFKSDYGKQPIDFYRIEKAAYERIRSNIPVLYDDIHHLIYLRELNTPNREDDAYFEQCLKCIWSSLDYLTDLEKDTALKLFEKKPADLNGIESLLQKFNTAFPNFYFECSGFFSPNLCWKIATLLLEYNVDVFSEFELCFLQDIQTFFDKENYLITPQNLYMINQQILIEHILKDNEEMVMVNYEKTAIGPCEAAFSSFIYDYCQEMPPTKWYTFLTNLTKTACLLNTNKKMLFSMIAYHSFYNLIYNKVLFLNDKNMDYQFLETIKKVSYEYSTDCSTPR